MSSIDLEGLENAIMATISSRSSENDRITLAKVQMFASHAPAPDISQLESTLRDIYDDELPTQSLDLFVEILYIMREHLVESISRVWWDLVLQPALRREHMSQSCIEHAISVTMVALREGETIFRRRLIRLFTLGVPSHNSADDAIDNVSTIAEERTQMARWKSSLMNILTEDAMKRPTALFEEVNSQFATADARLPLTGFMSKLIDHDGFPIVDFGNNPLLMTMICSMLIDNSGKLFSLQLTALTKLLPLFIVKSPTRLTEIVPELLAILARAICWPRHESHDPPYSSSRNPEVCEELHWQRLESSSEEAISVSPDAMRYFTFLYGVYPCNCVTFLRDPIKYLEEKNYKSPFSDGWAEFFDEEEIRTQLDPLLRHHILHPALVKRSAEEELESVGFLGMDVSELVKTFTLLDVRGASQGIESIRARSVVDIWAEGGEILTRDDGSSTPILERNALQSQRAVISIRQLMETHMMLRSGMPIDIMNDFDDGPSMPRAHAAPVSVYEVAAENLYNTLNGVTPSGPRSPEARSFTSTQRGEAKEEAISVLQRDILLLVNELNFETYLRRHYLAQISTLHKRDVQTRSSDRERQRMWDQIKRNELESGRHKREKEELQSQIDRYREGGDKYSADMRQQVHKMRQEKAKWLTEAHELRIKDTENKGVLATQSERLAGTETRIFELENEQKENEVKVRLIKDYEKQIELLRKAQDVWEADHLKLKRQTDIIEQTNGKLFSMQRIIDSEQNSNFHLTETSRSLENHLESLEMELEQARYAAEVTQNPEFLRHSRGMQRVLQTRVSSLEGENSKLRLKNSNLEEQLSQEQIKRETLQNCERQRQNNERSEAAASSSPTESS